MKEYIKKTIDVYDKLGKQYLDDVKHATPGEITLFMQNLPVEASVLDVGCAGGRDSKIFFDEGFRITGIDLCEQFLTEAEKYVPGGSFYKKDVLELDFEKESFDGIWASAILLHLDKTDVVEALKNFYELLKCGGVLFVGVKLGEGEDVVADKLSQGNDRYFSYYTEKEMDGLIEEAGFSIIYSKVINGDDVGRDELKWLRIITRK